MEVEITIAVAKADPEVTAPANLSATYGDSLASVVLPEGFAWKNADVSVGNAGNNTFTAIYTPADTNYNSVEVEVVVSVAKATPVAQIPTNLTATVGDTLASVILPAGFAWDNDSLTLTNAGVNTFSATYNPDENNYTTIGVEINVSVEKMDAFSIKLENSDTFLYRVGNENNFNIKYLFDTETTENLGNITVTAESVSTARATRSGNTVASASGLSFNDLTFKFDTAFTGPVKLTIASENANPITLFVEVVNGENITSVKSSINASDLVLLNDLKVGSNGTVHYQYCTVYGNGFTLDITDGMRDYNSKQGHGIVIAKFATIDNLKIEGAVFENYGAYNNQSDYSAAVDAENCVIQNCYISNCSAPIRSIGNTIINTTLYGGTVANLIISGGTNVLTDVTTINYNDGRGVLGFGIVINDGASENTQVVLNGSLTQHNYVRPEDISQIQDSYAQALFNSMFESSFDEYHIGADTYVNTGIVFLTESLDTKVITDNANTGYVPNDDASIIIKTTLGNVTRSGAIYSVPSTGTVDNNYVASAPVQGAYDLTLNFNLGDQAISYEGATDGNFLYYEGGVVYGAYTTGQAAIPLDLAKLAASCSVVKYGKALAMTAQCLDANGNPVAANNGVVTLSEHGSYTLVFTVIDDLFYNPQGQLTDETLERVYSVPVDLTVKDAAVADATITVSSSALTGDYINSGTNKKYKMYPLDAITSIMDDANKDGVLETFNFRSNIASAVITPEGANAFGGSITVTITYNAGQVLTVTLGAPSNLNSPGASNGGKTFSVKVTDSNKGIYLQSDGAVASSSAATGTWPITGWSFKGTSGTVITNNTQVTINFTKPSSGCVTGDTLITLADGSQKRVDQLTEEDLLLAWDFETGAYAAAPAAIYECHGTKEWTVVQLNFSNGTSVKIVDDHGFFDTSVNEFVFISQENVAEFVGHGFVCVDGDSYTTVTLDSFDIYTEVNSIWTIQVAFYNNSISNGMFTLNTPDFKGWLDYFDITDEMVYDQAHKQAEIAKYGLADYTQFAHLVSYEQFLAFNGQYLNILMGRGVLNMADLELLISMYLK